jgi:hypothetical protein
MSIITGGLNSFFLFFLEGFESSSLESVEEPESDEESTCTTAALDFEGFFFFFGFNITSVVEGVTRGGTS